MLIVVGWAGGAGDEEEEGQGQAYECGGGQTQVWAQVWAQSWGQGWGQGWGQDWGWGWEHEGQGSERGGWVRPGWGEALICLS